ncbi:MAG: hypothetical protein J0H20_06645, partial [Rhizobiales bacterium]|nr:hypothetical protein [Hyphomicrobiales bacterium]
HQHERQCQFGGRRKNTPPRKKDQKKAAPAAKKEQPAAQAGEKPQSAWVKLCEKAPIVLRDKEGKPTREQRNICLTHHERLDGNTGLVLVSAAFRQVEGEEKQLFARVTADGELMRLRERVLGRVYASAQCRQVA